MAGVTRIGSVADPYRLTTRTRSPSRTPAISASTGAISSRSDGRSSRVRLRPVIVPALKAYSDRPVVSTKGYLGVVLLGRRLVIDACEVVRACRMRTNRRAESACPDASRSGRATGGPRDRAARRSCLAHPRSPPEPRSRCLQGPRNRSLRMTHRAREVADDRPVRPSTIPIGGSALTHALDPPFGVHERAVFLERRARGQEHRAELDAPFRS